MKKRVYLGFTLLEVLIALVILAISFTSFFMTISLATKQFMYIQDKTAANFIALNILTTLQMQANTLSPINLNYSGQEIMFEKRWYWQASLSPYNNQEVMQVDILIKSFKDSDTIMHLIGYLTIV